MIEIHQLEHASTDYLEMIDLRMRVLLNPIGIPEHYINKEKEKEDILIGAFDEGQLVGCCILTSINDNSYQLRQMAVANEMQGHGLGGSILVYAEKLVSEKQIERIILHARNPVIPFYEKHGYSIVGEEFFEVGIGHHVMEKQLPNVSQ